MTVKEDIDIDLAEMLDPLEFGTEVTFTPLVGVPLLVNVVIDNDPVLVDLGDNNESIRSSRRTLQIKLSDFVSDPLPFDDTFTFDSVEYSIYDIEPDGTGYAIVVLNS